MKPETQILIGKLATIPSALVVVFMLNDGVWPIEFDPSYLVPIALLAVYAFVLSCNWLRVSLVILTFVTVNMIALTFGVYLLIILCLSAILLLYQGVIGIYRKQRKQMNIKAQVTLCFWVTVTFVMGFCPPWRVPYKGTRYGLLWYPPAPDVVILYQESIDVGRLSIQWLIVAAMSCVMIHFFQNRRRQEISKNKKI